MREKSIGIFDSGFGGLTVMNAVKTLLPHENIIYFGDTANLPYGNKSAEAILEYSLQNTQFLISLGIKLLIIACHTVCTTAYKELVAASPIPVVGMIEPSIALLQKKNQNNRFLLLGTRRTIDSGVYQETILREIPGAHLIALPCPLFVPLVEEGYANHPIAELLVKEHLTPLKKENLGTALLGCTHYPLLQHFIQKELGNSVCLIDPAQACALQVKKILEEAHLLGQNTSPPNYQFYVSDEPEKFRDLGKKFLSHPIERVFSSKS